MLNDLKTRARYVYEDAVDAVRYTKRGKIVAGMVAGFVVAALAIAIFA